MSGDERPARAPQWARQLDEESFSFEEAIGGWRGLVESVLPGLVFVVCFIATREVVVTSLLSAATALLALGARLVQRQSVSQALSGFLGVAIGAVWALASGRGEDFYSFGLIVSALFLLGVLVTILIGRPFVSLGVGAFWGLDRGWASSGRLAPLAKRCLGLSWMWAGVFALRLAVEVPLWRIGAVAQLGVAKLILGLPLFALAAWATWLGLRPFAGLAKAAGTAPGDADEDGPGERSAGPAPRR